MTRVAPPRPSVAGCAIRAAACVAVLRSL